MFGLQPTHLVLILVIALIIFGPKQLPELGKALGKTITEFKKSTREMTDSVDQAVQTPQNNAPANPPQPPAPTNGPRTEA